MPYPESAWRAEMDAHSPQAVDRIALARLEPELFEWRAMLCEEPGLGKSLRSWEAYVEAHRLAVALEQVTEDGDLDSEEEMARYLAGCPTETRAALTGFLQSAPAAVRDYLAATCYSLVRIARQRRTGRREWRIEASSGSPELLQELMFKWGPRFRRHRWTW
jgi:hypothetical protein